MKWEDVTDTFSERARHYNGKYLEICEVYDDKVEVSLFSSPDDLYEIYLSIGIFYGIVYVDKEEATTLRQAMKKELVEEYKVDKGPSDNFINTFGEKYKVCLPDDILFNFNLHGLL